MYSTPRLPSTRKASIFWGGAALCSGRWRPFGPLRKQLPSVSTLYHVSFRAADILYHKPLHRHHQAESICPTISEMSMTSTHQTTASTLWLRAVHWCTPIQRVMPPLECSPLLAAYGGMRRSPGIDLSLVVSECPKGGTEPDAPAGHLGPVVHTWVLTRCRVHDRVGQRLGLPSRVHRRSDMQ